MNEVELKTIKTLKEEEEEEEEEEGTIKIEN
ncbi:MAG: hypothetical protein ACJARX_002527 [Psychroserpens sp.]|jgi:hypothetical protein